MKYIKKIFTALLIIGTLIALTAIIYIWNYQPDKNITTGKDGKESHVKAASKGKVSQQNWSHKKDQVTTVQENKKPLSHKKIAVAIIIDDIGRDLNSLDELINTNARITFAILPYCAHSTEAAKKIHSAGREILLHLPMEPSNYPLAKPGTGAIFVNMSDQEIRRQVEANINSLPYICGVNNHMGSLFMENERKLAVVFEQLKEKRLFFIDSRTTPFSSAKKLAAKMEIPFAERKIFIDNDNNYSAIYEKLMTAINDKQKENGGKIVMIGHPYPETIQALKKAIPLIKAEGVEIIPVSELLITNSSKNNLKMSSKRS